VIFLWRWSPSLAGQPGRSLGPGPTHEWPETCSRSRPPSTASRLCLCAAGRTWTSRRRRLSCPSPKRRCRPSPSCTRPSRPSACETTPAAARSQEGAQLAISTFRGSMSCEWLGNAVLAFSVRPCTGLLTARTRQADGLMTDGTDGTAQTPIALSNLEGESSTNGKQSMRGSSLREAELSGGPLPREARILSAPVRENRGKRRGRVGETWRRENRRSFILPTSCLRETAPSFAAVGRSCIGEFNSSDRPLQRGSGVHR